MRRILKAEITFISLVPRGANKMPVIYKSADGQDLGSFGLETLVQKGSEEGELTAVVYAPESRDSQGDIASAAVIKQMAHSFQKSGGQIDIKHDGHPVDRDQAYVAESFLIAKGDARFADLKDYDNKPVDATGAWAVVIKVDDPDLRRLYREGGWDGVSMFGTASVQSEKSDDVAPTWFTKFLKAVGLGTPTPNTTEEIPVEKQELIDVLKANNDQLIAALKPEAPKDEPKDEPKAEVIKFEGDPSDPEAVEAHLNKIKLAKVDWTDPKAVEAHLASLNKADDDGEDSADEGMSAQDKEIKALRKKLAKAEGRTNQPDSKDAPDDDVDVSALTKEEVQSWKLGSRMAQFVNTGR